MKRSKKYKIVTGHKATHVRETLERALIQMRIPYKLVPATDEVREHILITLEEGDENLTPDIASVCNAFGLGLIQMKQS